MKPVPGGGPPPPSRPRVVRVRPVRGVGGGGELYWGEGGGRWSYSTTGKETVFGMQYLVLDLPNLKC